MSNVKKNHNHDRPNPNTNSSVRPKPGAKDLPPMSFSMMVDANNPRQNNQEANRYPGYPGPKPLVKNKPFSRIEPRKIYSWVKDEAATQCYGCRVPFGFMLRKHHCIPAGTPVTLANGMAVPIEKVSVGTNIPAWDSSQNKMNVNSPQVGAVFDQGKNSCLCMILEDGRQIVATSDHRFLRVSDDADADANADADADADANTNASTDADANADDNNGSGSVPTWCKMQDIKPGDRIVCSAIQGVLDDPEEDGDKDYVVPKANISLQKDRYTALAYARLCGIKFAEGRFYTTDDADIYSMDLSLIDDVEILHDSEIVLPEFMTDDECPISLQREFIAAIYGSCDSKEYIYISHFPLLVLRSENGAERICHLLKTKFNITSANVSSGSTSRGKTKFLVKFSYLDLPRFMRRIGFRYSIDKQITGGVTVAYQKFRSLGCNKSISFLEFCKEVGFSDEQDNPVSRALNLKVLLGPAVYKKGAEVQLYDLNVPGYESFVANGVVVHNCRLCGRIFCYKCSGQRMKVPSVIRPRIPVPKIESKGMVSSTLNMVNPLNLVSYYSSGESKSPISPILEKTQEITDQISNAMNIPKIINEGRRVAGVAGDAAKNMMPESPNSGYLMGKYLGNSTDPGDPRNPGNPGNPGLNTGPKRIQSRPSTRIREDDEYSLNGCKIKEDEKVRVCQPCAHKLEEINKLENMIKIFKLVQLDILDWKNISQVCQSWRQIANYYLSRFREIQYYLPGHKFSKDDRDFLWINREYLIGHGLWVVQLLRSIDYEDYDTRQERLEIVIELVNKFMGTDDLWGSEGDSEEIDDEEVDKSIDSWLNIDVEYSTLSHSVDNDLFGLLNDFSAMDSKSKGKTDKKVSQSVFANFGCCSNKKNREVSYLDFVEMKEIKPEKNNKQEELENLVQTAIHNQGRRKATCWQLMCSRHCRPYLRPEDALTLLDHSIQSKPIRELAIRYLGLASNWELRCYLPLLVHYIRYETIDNSVIGSFIIKRCLTPEEWDEADGQGDETKVFLDPYFMNDVYWQLKINLESKAFFPVYKFFLDRFCHEIPKEILETIFRGQHFINLVENLPKGLKEEELRPVIYKQINQDTIPYLTLPTEPFLDYYDLDVENLHIKQSATQPLIMPFKYEAEGETEPGKRKEEEVYQILYKNEDVRKDQIIMKIIKLMDLILQEEEGLDLNIITYEVRPTSSKSGLIEIIPECATMYHIKERMKFSVLNYIIEHNPGETVEKLRERFLQSCAAYCVITYLLGIGDRHLDNIMVTKEGVLFHIDYGFILGFDPKPMTSPKMRIDPDMVDALGGEQSQYYGEFKVLCNRIYNCLRRHVNLFINILSLLVEVDPPIENRINFTRKILMEEIMKRFIPGENYEEAELQLTTQIENSSNTYGQYLNDFFHYHARENTLQSTLQGTYDGTKHLLYNLLYMVGPKQ